MLDQEKWIGAQSTMKELINAAKNEQGQMGSNAWQNSITAGFRFCMGLMEDYATIPEGEEFVNTGIDIPKQFWNLDSKAQTEWLTEFGKPLPVINKTGRKEWFVHVRNKDLQKLKKVFDDRQNNFDDMVKTQEKI